MEDVVFESQGAIIPLPFIQNLIFHHKCEHCRLRKQFHCMAHGYGISLPKCEEAVPIPNAVGNIGFDKFRNRPRKLRGE